MSEENKKSSIVFVDYIKAILRDKNGKIKAVRETNIDAKDTMTNSGFAAIAGLILSDVGGTAFDFIAIGTGTTAPLPTNTTLEAEVKRKAGVGTRVTISVTNDTAQLVATFSSEDGLSGQHNITETGMFNSISGGTMLFRQTFTAIPCDWDIGDTLEMIQRIQCKQGS